ncbi:hypothetical protein E2C01_045864 [Portunus trituberculatus]|uniref:Uncharacterized protein n=1 Tax=Portunus trituberculatus TaxID=210409 RepID=A0A5B7G3H6_PORTR|nr:hypothetical protein [Portunus trituberculatus]
MSVTSILLSLSLSLSSAIYITQQIANHNNHLHVHHTSSRPCSSITCFPQTVCYSSFFHSIPPPLFFLLPFHTPSLTRKSFLFLCCLLCTISYKQKSFHISVPLCLLLSPSSPPILPTEATLTTSITINTAVSPLLSVVSVSTESCGVATLFSHLLEKREGNKEEVVVVVVVVVCVGGGSDGEKRMGEGEEKEGRKNRIEKKR